MEWFNMFNVVALGELLIDFTPIEGDDHKSAFEQNPGGAPANVLATVAKLGKTTAFLGMVGKDQFGEFLENVLIENKIDVTGLKFTRTVNTTLAFVHLYSNGDRSFNFYRNPGADMMLSESDVNYDMIRQSKVFHFGSISMTDEPARGATLAACKFAKDNGLIISYDPNYRAPLWSSVLQAKENIAKGLEFADILKISEEELELITGTTELETGASILFNQGIKVVLITLGSAGCHYKYAGGEGHILSYRVAAIDATGAGDAFLGALLYRISDMNMDDIYRLTKEEFEELLDFSNAAGALTTTKTGAIPALPSLDDIEKLRKKAL
jgi:fructokinase